MSRRMFYLPVLRIPPLPAPSNTLLLQLPPSFYLWSLSPFATSALKTYPSLCHQKIKPLTFILIPYIISHPHPPLLFPFIVRLLEKSAFIASRSTNQATANCFPSPPASEMVLLMSLPAHSAPWLYAASHIIDHSHFPATVPRFSVMLFLTHSIAYFATLGNQSYEHTLQKMQPSSS